MRRPIRERFGAVIYWPALLTGIAVAVIVPVALLRKILSPSSLHIATLAVASFAVILFLFNTFNPETQRTVGKLNSDLHDEWSDRSWLQSLFRRIGDFRLQLCSWVLWGEWVIVMFVQDWWVLGLLGAGFAVVVMALIMNIKAS